MRFTIPHKAGRHGGHRPATISPSTQSIGVAVNGGQQQIFNTTPTSPNCSPTGTGTTCNVVVTVPFGTDVLTVTTYSDVNAGGYPLDQAVATVNIVPNQPASLSITLGPVVSNANDDGPGSLRQAVAEANPNDTITFILPLPNTIVLTSGEVDVTQNVNLAGPGKGSLTISGGNNSEIFLVYPSVTATIAGMTMTRGSELQGGAIANGGNLTVASDDFLRNGGPSSSAGPRHRTHRNNTHPLKRAKYHPHGPRGPHGIGYAVVGAAIFSDYNAVLTVTNSVFNNNATNGTGVGGAIYASSGGQLNVAASTFHANNAQSGGAIYTDAPATLVGDSFTGNTQPSGSNNAQGAGVYATANLSVSRCSFVGNIAGGAVKGSQGAGAAIYQEATGQLRVDSSMFDSNVAGGGTNNSNGYGGAIYYGQGTSPLVVTNDTFQNNTAGGDQFGLGGAIYGDGSISASQDSFSNNAASGTGSGGYASGGAIYGLQTVVVQQSSFDSNSSLGAGATESDGGALYASGAATLTTVTFTNNVTGGSSTGGNANGGGAYIGGDGSVLTDVTFSKNGASAAGAGATAYGGGAYLFGITTIANGTLDANTATITTGAGGQGGGLYVANHTTFTGTVSNNIATSAGGGIYNEDNLMLTNSTIAGNSVASARHTSDGGGGIYNNNNVTISGSTISQNRTSGAVANTGGAGLFNFGTFAIVNSTITGNQAAMDGGGIENIVGGGGTLVNVTVYQNSAASGRGGNLKNLGSSSSFSIANSIVAGGSAASFGPDISNEGTITSGDYNIVQTAVSGHALSGAISHNKTVNPQLAALANNGGATQTNADFSTSPGTNYIPLAACTSQGVTTDQRGQPRGDLSDGLCDVGAYEFQGP